MTSDGERMILRELDEIKGFLAKQNGRLRNLEVWRAYILGIMATLAFLCGGGGLYLWRSIGP